MDDLWQIASQFLHSGKVSNVREYGHGNINDTYLIEVTGNVIDKFILQRINKSVFSHPKKIIQNYRAFTEHVIDRLNYDKNQEDRRWELPAIRKTVSGEDYYICSQGEFWRGISYIDHARSFDTVQNNHHALEAGYALGRFQDLVSDLDVNKMHDTLPGFHITPQYLRKYDDIKNLNRRGYTSPEVHYCQQFIETHRSSLSVLETAKRNRKLQLRIIHGDPKINNFMICEQTDQAVSVVDMDTVKPGLVHYDIGDCLRSACNLLGEETQEFEKVYFDTDLARSILEGYFSVANKFLTKNDYVYLYDAIWLIPFELGLRFFTDFLAGNVYFKVKHTTHNLERTLVQFKLTESIEIQEAEIRAIIQQLSLLVSPEN